MPGRNKPFINKKEAITFHLVHRSQQDPLLVSDEASQHVLVQGHDKKENTDTRREEQRKFGVFFDDDYDYMQHLKDTDEIYEVEIVERIEAEEIEQPRPRINIPSSALPSEYEKPVGLLNEAVPVKGPRPDWDPDIVEALDDDFDYNDPDNQLEDDFIQMANPGDMEQDGDDGSDLENVSDLDSDAAQMSDNDDFDADYKYGDTMFMEEETKSQFTNYSMSSSVIRRNEGLTLLDDRFEQLFAEYDDSEIGALDQEEIDGNLQSGSRVLDSIVEEFERKQKIKKLKEVVDEKAVQSVAVETYESSSESDTELVTVEVKPEEKWDCESILSNYSNLYNHPRLISEPTKVKNREIKLKHGIPEDSIGTRGLTENEINQLSRKDPMDKASTYRPTDETAEERAERKKAVKQERRERRQEKKQNKKAFTKEKIRQDKELINVNTNLKGIKIV